jgi:DNA-binding GntR family transcriptional regulator
MIADREEGPLFLRGRRQTIAVQVHDHLRRQIVEGHLPPHHQLSENELSQTFGISRTPIREAFGKLEEEGLVEIVPQYGTFVAPIHIDEVYNNQFVREALECAALDRAIERIDAEGIRRLSDILDTQRRHLDGDALPFFQADEDMHEALMTIAGQQRAWRVAVNAKVHLDRVRRLAMRDPMRRQGVLVEHQTIVDRVIHRDRAGALSAMQAHLRRVFRSVEPVMAEHPQFFTNQPAGLRIPRRPPAAG